MAVLGILFKKDSYRLDHAIHHPIFEEVGLASMSSSGYKGS